MLSNRPITHIVFTAIKTVSQYPSYSDLSVYQKNLFCEKYAKDITERCMRVPPGSEVPGVLEEVYREKAALSPEFGKIACITMGPIAIGKTGARKMILKTFTHSDESSLLNALVSGPASFKVPSISNLEVDFCGHGIKGFAFPFITKRLIANDIDVPAILDSSGVKPWDMSFLVDTTEAWKMTSWEGGVSLNLLAETLGIQRDRDIISGKEVHDVYHTDHDMEKIEKYCLDDAYVLAQVYCKMKGIKEKIIK